MNTQNPTGTDLAAALRAGEAGALGRVLTRYGDGLFDYAAGLLHDVELAVDVVHNALLVAQAKASRLRRQQHLTPWLYALVRNECLRMLKRGQLAAELSGRPAPHMPSLDHERVWVAAGSLSTQDRELIDLTLRHHQGVGEVALVLGTPSRLAAERVELAVAELSAALDMLALSESRAGLCGQLNGILDHWDGAFTPGVRKKLARHAAVCETCGGYGRHRITDFAHMYSELAPVVAPAGLDEHLLASAARPEKLAYRAEMAGRLSWTGFPEQLDRPETGRPALLWVAGVVVCLLLVGTAFVLMRHADGSSGDQLDSRPRTDLTTVPTAPTTGPPDSSTSPSASASPSPSSSASPSVSPSPSSSRSPSVSSPSNARPGTTPSEPRRSPAPTPKPSYSPTAPSTGQSRVRATFDRQGGGCSSWSARVTATVEGANARGGTVFWWREGGGGGSQGMSSNGPSSFSASLNNLPTNVTIYWAVSVTLSDGSTASTQPRPTFSGGC